MEGIKCFISYSHKDKQMCDRFRNHLSGLSRIYNIEEWYDGMIPAGGHIDKEILINLKKADVIFLLISPDFISSYYCYENELSFAIKKHNEEKCIVIPVICKKIIPGKYIFSHLKFVPTDGRPINSFKPQDSGFIDAFTGISNLFEEFFKNKKVGYQTKRTEQKRKNIKENSQDIRFPIIKNKKISTEKLTQTTFQNLCNYSLLLPQFILKIEEMTNKQLQEISSLISSRTSESTMIACSKNNFESYLIQIFSYIQQIFIGVDSTCVHFRFKKGDKYFKIVNIGYPVVNLSTKPIFAQGGMIECSRNYNMPIIKSFNKTLHKATHPYENIKRDYITFTFSTISKLYNIDLSMCISIVDKTTVKCKDILIPLSILRVDEIIEKFLLQYISSCMQLNSKWNLQNILDIEE